MPATPVPVASLYQAQQPPLSNGIRKPMKPGGYADSGADMAYVLRQHGRPVVTPMAEPNATRDLDWVFPDTAENIAQAKALGVQVLWLKPSYLPATLSKPFWHRAGT